jgi:DNA repair protein RadD
MTLRWYQSEAVGACWQWLCNNDGNPVVMLPTGAGKSHVIAEVCRVAKEKYNGRMMVLAHRKELLTQNAEKIRAANPGLDVGVYSAGLGARDTEHDVICAGVQSVFRRPELFGLRHLVLIDEVHLVPHDGEGMYRTFVDGIRAINPWLRMVGLTATPYRLDSGPICRPSGLFHKLCYSAPVRQLIDEGWLCNLTTTPAEASVNTSGLRLRAGEFIQGETEQLFATITQAACREIISKAAGRQSVLVFASGVNHAEHVAETLEKMTGEPVGVVTGETFPMERQATLIRFRRGQLRWVVNVDVLTTGFDAPNIDCIAVLRATMSPGLFAQIVGRGFRTDDGKLDCLVLDFGGNIRRHGPIDSPVYGVQDKRQQNAGEAPTKVCPACREEVLIGTRECQECGFLFPIDPSERHEGQADEAPILAEPESFMVETVGYQIHVKRKAGPDAARTMRVDYECQREGGGDLSHEVISEWVCIEHDGFARKNAVRWWRKRSIAPVPDDVEEAVDLARRGALAAPSALVARKDGRWWRVLETRLEERPEERTLVAEETLGLFGELECHLALWVLERIDSVLLVLREGLEGERAKSNVACTFRRQQVTVVHPAEFWDQLAFAPSPASPAESRSLIEVAILRIEEDRS